MMIFIVWSQVRLELLTININHVERIEYTIKMIIFVANIT